MSFLGVDVNNPYSKTPLWNKAVNAFPRSLWSGSVLNCLCLILLPCQGSSCSINILLFLQSCKRHTRYSLAIPTPELISMLWVVKKGKIHSGWCCTTTYRESWLTYIEPKLPVPCIPDITSTALLQDTEVNKPSECYHFSRCHLLSLCSRNNRAYAPWQL